MKLPPGRGSLVPSEGLLRRHECRWSPPEGPGEWNVLEEQVDRLLLSVRMGLYGDHRWQFCPPAIRSTGRSSMEMRFGRFWHFDCFGHGRGRGYLLQWHALCCSSLLSLGTHPLLADPDELADG